MSEVDDLAAIDDDPFRPRPTGVTSRLIWILGGAMLMLGIAGMITLYLAVTNAQHAPRRSQCKNNLKQIGLALHNYHDEYHAFPPAFVPDDQGRPMHSWRVLILPYLDQAALYKEYRFDEAWDGPNNLRLAGRIADVFRCPSESGEEPPATQWTSYVAVVGPDNAWAGSSSRTIADVQDGLSNTLLIVEVADSGIHWMEPRDLHVSQMAPTINPKGGQGISSRHTGGAHALLGDGAVRYLSETMSAESVRGLLTITGGERPPENF